MARGVEESNTASTQDVVLWERDPRSQRTFLQASRRSRPEFTGMASTVASASWCTSMLVPWCCSDCSTSAALAASNSMELQFDLGAPSFLAAEVRGADMRRQLGAWATEALGKAAGLSRESGGLSG
eukprot:CAMPEP_0177431948 /NCGR_PEP_ID=MMETSP0368-20130122/76442_1 /TAXON_ID=447022 ORGANISM="Scrippsiella hangoei-like, Strain SHHI-4" /NCGR_SAMPLE_ID=MMETSP0368 /ASSEMBLY_ACC=CAM_ASM_000363 /LENGTH=125 /DNA_ID=CAMNT_0018902603 /DNA_START=218 /DNA_END=593 /DNA_ORIENTATION=-